VFAPLCAQVRTLSIADADQQRAWLMARLQPYQVEALDGTTEGLLTAYFEPVLQASRRASAQFSIPLYQPPVGLAQRKPWYTRQEIDTSAQAQAALRGREIAFLADPIDALILQIQGSGRLRVSQADGTPVTLRLSYAGSNEHPYKSVGRWLIDQGALRDASWPSIKAWLQRNPERVNELLWSNPRGGCLGSDRRAGCGVDAGALHCRRSFQHSLRHTGLAGLERTGRSPAKAGAGAGRRQRHHRCRASRLFCWFRRRSGRARGSLETAAAALGTLAQEPLSRHFDPRNAGTKPRRIQ
jgi:hypothetical protein